jgi:hypothetical protein
MYPYRIDSTVLDQLAGQALDRAVPETWTTLSLDQLKKFQRAYGELVIAEAVDVLQRRFMGDLNREDQEVRRCIADLKQHFGIEE